MADAPAEPITPPAEPGVQVQPVTSQDAPNALEAQQMKDDVASLNKLFDDSIVPASTVVEPPPPQSTPTEKPPALEKKLPEPNPIGAEGDFQKKLDGIQAPPGAHPNLASGINQLKELANAERKRAEELQVKVKDYETKISEVESNKGKLPENVEKELETLRAKVRDFDLTSDPEFQENYSKPVQQSEGEIMGMLKTAGATDETLKWIAEHGGIVQLSQSMEKVGDEKNPDLTFSDWVNDVLLRKTPAAYRTRIMGKLSSAADILEKGRSVLQDWQANSKERFDQKMKQIATEFEAGKAETIASLGDLAKPKAVTNEMQPEQREAAEAHNARLQKATEKFTELSQKAQGNPKVAAEILVKATQADVLTGYVKELEGTVAKLNDRIKKITAAGSHSVAGDKTAPGPADKPEMATLLKTSTEDAMSNLFKTVPAGT